MIGLIGVMSTLAGVAAVGVAGACVTLASFWAVRREAWSWATRLSWALFLVGIGLVFLIGGVQALDGVGIPIELIAGLPAVIGLTVVAVFAWATVRSLTHRGATSMSVPAVSAAFGVTLVFGIGAALIVDATDRSVGPSLRALDQACDRTDNPDLRTTFLGDEGDGTWLIAWVSGAPDTTGRTAEEVRGLPAEDVFTSPESEAFRNLGYEALRTGEVIIFESTLNDTVFSTRLVRVSQTLVAFCTVIGGAEADRTP